MSELIGALIGAVLALFALSYLVGDNPLYRLALHIFAGVLIGYSLGVVVRDVLIRMAFPRLIATPSAIVVPLVLGILLLFKGFPKQAFVGNFSMGLLIGVGTAVALAGALVGTLGPQVEATGRALSAASLASFRFGLLDGLMIVVGTICTLLAFTFTQGEDDAVGLAWRRLIGGAAWVGRVFLVFAFGIAFAGALTASLSVFIGRMEHFINLARRAMGL
jgi:hypothetical protein